jgi:hypothetical protein
MNFMNGYFFVRQADRIPCGKLLTATQLMHNTLHC